MPSDTNINNLIINKLTASQYENLKNNNQVNDRELYMITDDQTEITEETIADWGFTKNVGTITGITMNGASKGTSGVVDLGTIITAHQDISGKEDKLNKVTTITGTSTDTEYPSAKCVYDFVENSLESKQNKIDNTLQTNNKNVISAINEVNSIAKGANQALSYSGYSAMITAINSLASTALNVGQNIYIETLEVPDLWVYKIESTGSTYTYTTDAAFIQALETNGYVQVGYYKLSVLETEKVDLTGYARIESIPTELADLSDDSTHRLVTDMEKTTWNSKGTYSKPSGGIPKTDMTSEVQASLSKADTALQQHQDISGKVDKSSFTYDSTTETLTITIS